MSPAAAWPQLSPPLSLVEPAWGAGPEHPLRHLPQAYCLLRGDRWLLLANEAALALQREGLMESDGRRLQRLGLLGTTQLDTLLRLALGGTPSRTPLCFLPQASTGSLSVQLLAPALREAWGTPPDCLLISLQLDDPAQLHTARLEALCARSGLTPAERCVLLLLGDGIAPEAAAEQLGVRISTLRSHIRHLLAKTQSRSLLQLLRWLGSAAALPN